MKRLAQLGILCIFLVFSNALKAQDFSNKGKEFWITYSYHVGMTAGQAPTMTLYISSDVATTYNVEIFGGATIQTGNIVAGQVSQVNIPNSYFVNGDGPFSGKAIRVTAAKPVVVYSYITRSTASAATLCLPLTVLGREYYSSNFTQVSNESLSNSYITIVGVEDGTNVEITPTAATVGGWAANSTHTVSLNKGQVYQVLGTTVGNSGVDLTGTKIKSVASGSGGCKRIAVFSGSGKIAIGCSGASSDNLYQQLYPTGSWGQKYLTVPSYERPNNYYRIIRNDPTTVVTLNGTTIPSSSFTNNYYEFQNSTPNTIIANKPISVAQYFTSQGCQGNVGSYDPDMIMLNPVEQNIDKVTLVSSNLLAAGPQHHIHVIMRNGGTGQSSFKIDGVAPSGVWTQHPFDSDYSYLYLNNVSQGYHTLVSDSGFNAIAYGYAQNESYGYSAGANVKDLYQFVSIQNQGATVNFPATCRNTPFYFSMTFPYQPTQIQWVFNGLFPDVTVNNPQFDSTWVVNGKTLYRYKLPTPYTVLSAGTYPIKVIAQNPTADGCNGEQEINYDLVVAEQPSASFTFSTNGCLSDPVQFTNTSNTGGRPISLYNWNFGDGNTGNTANPLHTYTTPGDKVVSYSIITDIGCISNQVSQTVGLSNSPTANFNVGASQCANTPVTFTDASTTPSGTIIVWRWNFGDGSPVVVAGTNAPQTHTYTTPGNYTATLQVETASGCKSAVTPKQIVVSGSLVVSFSFGNACLPGGAVAFTNTSGLNGTGYTFAWTFGDGGTSALENPTHVYTGTGPYNAALTITSPSGCTGQKTQSVNTIYAQPTASISVNKTQACQGETLNFTGNAAAPGSTVAERFWIFGDGTTSTDANPTKSYPLPGTYFVKHYVKSAVGCVSDTARETITVLPPPTASFTSTGLRCPGSVITFTSTSVTNVPGVNPSAYTWFVNGASVGSGATYAWTPAGDGTYAIRLLINTPAGCTDDTTMNIQVSPLPVPDFTIPTVCLPNASATFTNTTTISDGTLASVTYQWTFGDGGTSTATNPTHTYSAAGPFDVKLIATSANGCIKDITKQITTIYPQPQALFASPTEVCLGGATSFTDQSTAPNSTVTQWLWTFDDGTTSTDQNPTKTFATAGTHAVTLKVTSAIGCVSAVYSGTAVVNALPAANFTISAPNCVTKDITFTDISIANAGTISTWNWDLSDGAPFTNNSNSPFTHTYNATGNYAVTLVVTTNKGCVGTKVDTARVRPLPMPGFAMPESCLSDPFSQFTDTSRIVDGTESGFTYSWNFGDNNATPANPNTGTGAAPRHKYTRADNYNVTMTVTSVNGCSATITQVFTVNGAVPESRFTILGSNQCSNDSIRIQNNSIVDVGSIGKLEIFWDAADPTLKTVDDNPAIGKTYSFKYPEFFTPATKTYSIRVVAYSGDNCLDPDVQTVIVKATPQVQFNVIPPVCGNQPAFQLTQGSTLNSAAVPGSGVYSGGGISSTGTFNPSNLGIGTATIRYTFTGTNGCINFAEQPINVYEVPTVDAGADKSILEGGSDTLRSVTTGNGLSYLWSPATWLSSSTAARPKVTPLGEQRYTLTVTSADGCIASDNVLVRFLKSPTIPNVFTPNGDGRNDKWEILHLETYPGATIEIYNRYGQIVYKSTGYSKPWDGTFNGAALPVGTYYYIINPKNGRQQMTGFVDLIR